MGEKKEKEKIKICYCHSDYEVPLIWTFAFPGAEYWCPYCGHAAGMMGAGTDVNFTEKLAGRKAIYEKYSAAFRNAKGTLTCSSTELNGGRIKPEDMPENVIKEIREFAKKAWNYNIKAMKLIHKRPLEEPEFKCVHCIHNKISKRCSDYGKSDIQICNKWEREKEEE